MKHTILVSIACALLVSANPGFVQAAKRSTISGGPGITTSSTIPLGRAIIKKDTLRARQDPVNLGKKAVTHPSQQ